MNPPITNATLYFLVQYFGLDIISTLLLYNPFWLKILSMSIYRGEGAWASCVRVKVKMKLTRKDLSNAKALDMFVMPW